jgi:hypothetical protein
VEADLMLLAQSATIRRLTLLISGANKASLSDLVDAKPYARIFGAALPDKPLRQLTLSGL